MTTKRIIIVSYYFPPLGLAGTARPLALANFFAGRGDDVTVITGRETNYPAYDQSALSQLDKRVTVIRTAAPPLSRMTGILRKSDFVTRVWRSFPRPLKNSLFPDTKAGFADSATAELIRLIDDTRETILITTSPPVSIHKAGLKLAGRDNLKWIADWRDIWGSLPYFDQSKSFVKRAKDYTVEILSACDIVTATSQRTLAYFEELVSIKEKSCFLPNGYDESDFTEPASDNNGSIGIYGTLNHLVGVERVVRWLGQVKSTHPEIDIRLRHTGYLDYRHFDALLEEADLEDRFISQGFLPHHESIQSIRANAANLIALSDEHDTSFIIPSRLFELLRAEPPLIALLPKGNAARRLLEEHQLENVYIADDFAAFKSALVSALDESKRKDPSRKRTGIEIFEREYQLEQFCKVTGI